MSKQTLAPSVHEFWRENGEKFVRGEPIDSDKIELEFRDILPPLQKRIESQSQTINSKGRTQRRMLSLVVAHAFNIDRLLKLRSQAVSESDRAFPDPWKKRKLLAQEFAQLEALAASYEALLAACDGDAAMLWQQMRRLRAIPSTYHAFVFDVCEETDGTR